ncbi:hypothetical protein BDZ85DRAFT_280492 [Elsinoe ampelina]|uniref:F-box domain-containing protein n=1 Tax=Elsinoe ampelina TaxID=302913 RepID=A0A6A6GHV8_9PEZI|nr:hypothetical protein BDZ85DRAFT_280492 [Elsinoe ampelina]
MAEADADAVSQLDQAWHDFAQQIRDDKPTTKGLSSDDKLRLLSWEHSGIRDFADGDLSQFHLTVLWVKDRTATSDLGTLGVLPQELLALVVRELHVSSLCNFKRTCRLGNVLVQGRPHALGIVQVLAQLATALRFMNVRHKHSLEKIGDLFHAKPECSTCRDGTCGPLVFLPTLHRACYHHASIPRKEYFCLRQDFIQELFGMERWQMEEAGVIKTISARPSHEERLRRSTELVSFQQALAVAHRYKGVNHDFRQAFLVAHGIDESAGLRTDIAEEGTWVLDHVTRQLKQLSGQESRYEPFLSLLTGIEDVWTSQDIRDYQASCEAGMTFARIPVLSSGGLDWCRFCFGCLMREHEWNHEQSCMTARTEDDFLHHLEHCNITQVLMEGLETAILEPAEHRMEVQGPARSYRDGWIWPYMRLKNDFQNNLSGLEKLGFRYDPEASDKVQWANPWPNNART